MSTKTKFGPEYIRQWFIMGHFFGYPRCCIDSFCDLKHCGKNNVQTKVAGTDGFIPCLKCAKRVDSGELTLNELIVDRKSPRPFPIDSEEMDPSDCLAWLKSLQP